MTRSMQERLWKKLGREIKRLRKKPLRRQRKIGKLEKKRKLRGQGRKVNGGEEIEDTIDVTETRSGTGIDIESVITMIIWMIIMMNCESPARYHQGEWKVTSMYLVELLLNWGLTLLAMMMRCL